MRFKSRLMIGTLTAGLGIVAWMGTIPAQASTFAITYSNAGSLDAAPVLNGNILTLDALATGSILSGNAALNAIWNPATFHTHDDLDLTTGLDIGTFTISLADGDTLFGQLFEVDSVELLNTNLGSFDQTLVFTGGTGQFAGASGFATGGGVVGADGFTASGSGILTAPGVSPVPEPSTVVLLGTGLFGAAGVARRKASGA